jgi:hypothetical protein
MTKADLLAQGTSQVSATGHVFAEVIPVFSASETAQMSFGRFAPGPDGGNIILSPEGTISVLGNVFTGTGTHNAASFYVTGDIDAAYTITLPADPVVLTHISSAKTLRVEDWVSVPAPGIGAGHLQGGFQVVYVGATLKMGTLYDNPVGIYTGTYSITFDFN